MIEPLLLSICLFGNEPACSNAGIAYYKHSGIEKVISSKEQKFVGEYPLTSALVGLTSGLSQGRVVLLLGKGRALTVDKNSSMLVFKAGF